MQVKQKFSLLALMFFAALLLGARSGPAQSFAPDAASGTSPANTLSNYSEDQSAITDSDSGEPAATDATAPDTLDLLSLPVRLNAEQILLAGLSPIPLGPNGAPGSSSSLPFIAIVGFGVLAGGIASAMRTRAPAR